MLSLHAPVYACYGVTDPAGSAHFATAMLGLEPTPQGFRAGFYSQSLFFHRDEDAIGIEITEDSRLSDILESLARDNIPARLATQEECDSRCVHQAIFFHDFTGNKIELVTRAQRTARQTSLSRDSGITGLQGFALRSTNIAWDTQLWATLLGARVSDRVGDITYLAFDSQHHRLALYPATTSGLLYTAFETSSLDTLMQNANFLRERQVRILQGPSKQAASSQIFLHVQGPEQRNFSYVHGIATLPPNHRPRQFTRDAASLCTWGSVCEALPELAPRNL